MRYLLIVVLAVFANVAGPSECAPPEAIAAYEAGMQLLKSGDNEAGTAELEKAVSIYPDFYEAYAALEWQYKAAERFAEALHAAEEQARIFPADDLAYNIAQYRRLLAVPISARQALAEAADYELGSDNAIAACRTAVQIYPDFNEAHMQLFEHYVYAGQETAAKRQLAELARLEPIGAAYSAIGLRELKPEWMTEEYTREINELISRHMPDDEAEKPQVFTEQDTATIKQAYERQIAVIGSLIGYESDLRDLESEYRGSKEIQDRLEELSFIIIRAESSDPHGGVVPFFVFFDDMQQFVQDHNLPYDLMACSPTRVASEFPVAGEKQAAWQVGLCEILIERPYCRPDCIPIFEFKVSTEFGGKEHHLKAWVRPVDEVEGLVQCTN